MSSARTDVTNTAPADGEAHEPEGVMDIAKRVVSEFSDDDVPGMAAEIAYHAIFAIPPLLVVFITLAAVIDEFSSFNLAERLRDTINSSAPESTQEILNSLIENAVEQVGGGLASIGLAVSIVIALWAGSNGVSALIKSFNKAYDTGEDRSFIRKKLASIALTICLGLIVNIAFVLLVFGNRIGGWMAERFGMGNTFDWVWNISRYPLGMIVVVLMLMLLYYVGPNVNQLVRWVIPGAVLSTVLWVILLVGFSLYLTFANPGSAYGALGGVIIFLFFLYLTSIIFLVGAEVNAVLAHRYDEELIEDLDLNGEEVSTPQLAGAEAAGAAALARPNVSMKQLLVGALTTIGVVLIGVFTGRDARD